MIKTVILGNTTGELALSRPDGKLPLVVETVPVGSSAAPFALNPATAILLLIKDPEDDHAPAAESLRERYWLIAAEAAMAIHAARGKGLGAAAAALGIAPSTARSHLKRVFEKTNTHRQAELTWLLGRASE